MRRAALATAALLSAPALPAASQELAGDFDFYVLALSWSPSYCETEGGGNRLQCGAEADYGFIVHGLWPQFESGYPEFCETDYPERVARETGEPYFDIMPGMGLIGHQWRKHGSCTGLDPKTYLETMRAARGRIVVPEELSDAQSAMTIAPDAVEAAFIEANPGLSSDGMAAVCSAGNFSEVRICLTKDLDFRACPEVDADGCRQPLVEMPPR